MASYLERYARLRDDFRSSHTELGDAPISLCFCHLEYRSEACESVSKVWPTSFETIGVYRIPIMSLDLIGYFVDRLHASGDRRCADSMRFWGEHTVLHPSRPQQSCVAFVPVSDGAKRDSESAAAIKFKQLADKAGRELPRHLRSTIPWDFEPDTYVGRWLTLMFWHSVPDARRLLHLNQLPMQYIH